MKKYYYKKKIIIDKETGRMAEFPLALDGGYLGVENTVQAKEAIADYINDRYDGFDSRAVAEFLAVMDLGLTKRFDMDELDNRCGQITYLMSMNVEDALDAAINAASKVSCFAEEYVYTYDAVYNNSFDKLLEDAKAFITKEIEFFSSISAVQILKTDGEKSFFRATKVANSVKNLLKDTKKEKYKDFIEKYDAPYKIKEYLDKYIVGQENYKERLASLAFFHIQRLLRPELGIKKETGLIIGPSGCGKTECLRVLGKILPVKVHIIDSTQITSAGYTGADLSDVLVALDGISDAIVVFDEFDKVVIPSITSTGEDKNKEVQANYLKLLEGTEIIGKRKRMNTDGTGFIMCGAFPGLLEGTDTVISGFGDRCSEKYNPVCSIADVTKALEKYGMLVEIIRRVTCFIFLGRLTASEYRQILYVKDGIIDSIRNKYLSGGYNFVLDEDCIEELVEISSEMNIGAGGIRAVLEDATNNRFYEATRNKDKAHMDIKIGLEDIRKTVNLTR